MSGAGAAPLPGGGQQRGIKRQEILFPHLKVTTATATVGTLVNAGTTQRPEIGVGLATATTAGAQSAAAFAGLALLLDPPRFRLYNTANQAIASATVSALGFNTMRYNTAGASGGAVPWTLANALRATVPAGGGGLWTLTANVQFANSAGGSRRFAALRVNGATVIGEQEQGPGLAGSFPEMNVTAEYQLAAGDYVEVVVYQDSGAALNVLALGNHSYEFSGRRVCA